MNQSLSSLSVAQLRQAIVVREKIEALEKELISILGGTPVAAPAESAESGKKRQMSPEARAKIGAAQKARWAKQKRAKPAPLPARGQEKPESKPKQPKRKMSPAGRRRLSELAIGRWAKVRASGKTSLKAG